MNAISPSPIFPGIETPPDPVDGSLVDALTVALRLAGDDRAEAARHLRAELRRMDIELILVVRLADSRRSDLVSLAAYTLVLAQRNAALKDLALYHTPRGDGDPVGHVERQVAIARRLALSMKDDLDAARAQLAERDAEIARLKVEVDNSIALAGDLQAEIDTLKATEGR